MFEKSLPIYTTRFDQDVFCLNYSKWDKQMMTLLSGCIRFAIIEEMKRVNLDNERIKTFTEGKMCINPLYKHAIQIIHQCKLYITSNHTPKFKAADSQGVDSGLIARGLFVATKNRFLGADDYEEAKANNETNIHHADETLLEKFDDPAYQLAFIHVLLPYAQEMFTTKTLGLPLMRKSFKEVCMELDRFKKMLKEHYENTNNDDDKISKAAIQKRYKSLYGVELSDATIISEGKRCCLTYDKNKTNKGERGVFVGLKLKTKEKSTIEDDLDSED